MFQLREHFENCSSFEADNNNSNNNGTQSLQMANGLGLVKACFVLLGAVNLVLNCLCFFVFLCHRQRENTVRRLLLILSFNEMLTSFGMTSVETVRILAEVVPSQVRYPSAAVARALVSYLTVTWVLANAFLMARNWSVVLIAVSRCEAVLRPFSRNTGRCFGHRTIVATSAGIVLLGFASAVPKAFQEKFHYCTETGLIYHKEMLSPFGFYSEFYVTTAFLQAVLPVVIVAIASVAMTIGLRRSRRQQELGERVGGASAGASQHSKATRTIQILLLAFVCMETPMFLIVLVGTRVESLGKFWDTAITYAISVANLCINLDSTCNFIIYMTTNSMFRTAVLQRRCCRRRGDLEADNRRLSRWTTARAQPHHQLHQTRRLTSVLNGEENPERQEKLRTQLQPLMEEQANKTTTVSCL